jgi:uncharacterized membrane protein YccC
MKLTPAAKSMRRSRLLVPLQSAWRDWLSDEALTIGYMLKVLLACLLAMWLSLRFELDQPRTAMMTVAIVMQSRSGMVFAKSYYRLLGTIIGVLVSVLLVALFAQERVLFLLCMAIWIGGCTAGSMIYRNHQSYAFVLAGYTLCIVGLPATIDPGQTFSISITRISEIMIGLFSATIVSDLVFPQRMWDVMLASVRRRFSDFSDLVRATALNPVIAATSKPALLRFISDIFRLETLRAAAVLENDQSRQHRLRLNQMNNEFMQASTSFHAFEQLLKRQLRRGQPQVSDALLALYRQLATALTLQQSSARDEHEALLIHQQLSAYRSSFAQALIRLRSDLPATLSDQQRLEFETGAELLERLADELYVYAATYGSLTASAAQTRSSQPEQTPKLEMHFDALAVSLAGIRGALALAILATLWIFTDWRSGIEAITIGVMTSTLFATSQSPAHTIKQFSIGAVLGTILAYFCNFHWLTHAQGFVMLVLAVSPGILFATWLTTRAATAVMGTGTFMIYLMHIGFNSSYSASPVIFINDAIADLLAVLLSGILFGLIDLSNSRWSKQRTARALRKLVVTACREPLLLRRSRLEASARDLVQRSGSAERIADEQDQVVIDWLLSTLEIGHAVIALREYLQEAKPLALTQPIFNSLDAIASLYAEPSEQRRLGAISAIDAAMAHLSTDAVKLGLMQLNRQQLMTMLHFIHSALLDEESVLAAGANPKTKKV